MLSLMVYKQTNTIPIHIFIANSLISKNLKTKEKKQCKTSNLIFEPRHDKTNIMGLRPAWIQTSLRIRAV
jgi:hypothetical protein